MTYPHAQPMRCLLSLTGVGLVLTLPLWIIATPIAMILAGQTATRFNKRNGILVR